VVTAFLIDTYKLLKPDTGEQSLAVLQQIAATLSGTPSIAEPPPSNSEFTPSTTALWVNALMFTSLTGSLAIGSFGMLVKQWIRSYQKNMHGPAETQMLLRQRRFESLQAWGVPQIVASLPLFLFLALIEFLVGLSLFLHLFNYLIGWIVLGMTIATVCVHIASLALPAFTDVHIGLLSPRRCSAFSIPSPRWQATCPAWSL
jgi:hypothetical protein